MKFSYRGSILRVSRNLPDLEMPTDVNQNVPRVMRESAHTARAYPEFQFQDVTLSENLSSAGVTGKE